MKLTVWGEKHFLSQHSYKIPYMFHFQVGLNGFCLSSFYVVILVQYQVSNMSTYRQFKKYLTNWTKCLLTKKTTVKKVKWRFMSNVFMNLFWQTMSLMHCVNDNNNLVKYFTFSLLDTFQSKNVGLVEKNVSDILETFIWWTWLWRSLLV